MRLLYFLLCCFIMIVTACNTSKKSVTKDAATDSITQMILDTNFVFHARNANPMAGGTIFLNYNYTLTVKSDSIIGWLPYYGRSFSAPLNPSDGGIKFTTVKYKYDIKPNKRKIGIKYISFQKIWACLQRFMMYNKYG